MGKFVCAIGGLVGLAATIYFSLIILDYDPGNFSGHYCPKCHSALYGDGIICKKDNAPANGYKYWFWSRGRPEPKMAYQAETYLIKTDKGEFVWSPYEVDLGLE